MHTFRNHQKRGRFAGPVVGFLLAMGPAFAGDADPAAEAAEKKELIRLQMINDMMYASDDFFGETRQLIYIDQPLPPVTAPEGGQPIPVGEKTPVDIPSAPDNGGGDPGGGDCPT